MKRIMWIKIIQQVVMVLFTVKEYPDEVFLNPNTFSTYDETVDDNWVGNFSVEDSLPATRAMHASPDKQKNIILTHCSRYASTEMTMGGGNSRRDNYTTETEYSDWNNVLCTKNILSAYSGWNQGIPFNDLYPRKRMFILFGYKKRVPAGCFPLAIAKIMAHF